MDALKNHRVILEDLGGMEFEKAWSLQTTLFENTISQKIANKNSSPENRKPTPNHLFFVEHPHVYTLGKSGSQANLLVSFEELKSMGASYFNINRGGDITYHGPGQLVAYPIFDLENFKADLGYFLRSLEEAVILLLKEFGLSSGRIKGQTGVWIDPDNLAKARKICAIGIKTSQWVSMHGLALNVHPDLSFFDHIIPCGIEDKGVTSMEKELGKKIELEKVKTVLISKLIEVFQMEIDPVKNQNHKYYQEHIRG